jgi:GT2 family glycosyltransferase/glycosyltransferase involved in cell wall biosynthesis
MFGEYPLSARERVMKRTAAAGPRYSIAAAGFSGATLPARLHRKFSRARARISAARGLRNKQREIAALFGALITRLLSKAGFKRWKPLAARRAISGPRPIAISSIYPTPGNEPGMTAKAGGIVFVSCGEHPPERVSVLMADRHGNLHQPRILAVRLVGISDADRRSAKVDEMTPAKPRKMAQLVAQVPSELFEKGRAVLDVNVATPAGELNFPDVVFESASGIAVDKFAPGNDKVLVSGFVTRRETRSVQLGAFVDGMLAGSGTLPVTNGQFLGYLPIDRRHLDGAAHFLELRELPNLQVLASSYEILPLHITPWTALQGYAQPPLDGTLAPQARHHLHSYRLWLENISDGARLPPLAALHAELLQGFCKRESYPPLEFAFVERPLVSIVIPVHNKFEVTYYCLCALQFAYNETSFEVIVVDDGSSDRTSRIEDIVSGITVIRHLASEGFVQSCNDGAARARGEFVALLNNDTQVTARWLDELVRTCREFENVGLVGSKLVYPDGSLQEAGGIIWKSGNPWNVGRGGNASDPRYNYLRQVDYVSGAVLLLPRDIWQDVGGFSHEFTPAYFEDTDLAMKVRAAGHLVLYVPTSTVYHFEGQSAGTDVGSGMKQFQEINRPKFKRKWSDVFQDYGREGEQPDREKDRNVALRVLFVDNGFPTVDMDAGSYAAFQEIRLFQSLGAKVSFLPRNLAWMDRHTLALQRIGVECLHAPFVTDFVGYLREHASEYDAVFVTGFAIAEQVIPLVRAESKATKIIFNLADLHFLRELREAAAKTPGYSRERAEATRKRELAVVNASDLTFSYSDVELAVLESHVNAGVAVARMPWILESRPRNRRFSDTGNILFLGGFGHPPNASAVKFFAGEVMPLLRDRLPGVMFDIVGAGADRKVPELGSDCVRVRGYVADLASVLEEARVFVAPLLAGAGIKGKVLDTMAAGVPSVLSPIAAEGTGLTDGVNCLMAKTPSEWADQVARLYSDEALWSRISAAAQDRAKSEYSFARGAALFEAALAGIDLYGKRGRGLLYRAARPGRYGY